MKQVSLIMTILLCLLLAGCGGEDNKPLTVSIFSEIPTSYQEEMKETISSQLAEKIPFELYLNLFMVEKLMVQIGAKDGDIFVAPEEFMLKILDKNGLTPLDALFEGSIPEAYEKYKATNEGTGEVHLYGIPLEKDSPILKNLGIQPQTQLVAILPQYSKHQESALKVLHLFIEK